MRHILLCTILLLLVAGFVASPVLAQRVNVTFVVNTCTMPDTLSSTFPVNITGSGRNHDADSVLTGWTTGRQLTNIGGDYWQVTLGFLASDTIAYKIRMGPNGWESDIKDTIGAGLVLANGNRNFIVPATDTVLPVQFWNNGHFASGEVIPSKYATPWSTVADSFLNVYFRVDMQGIVQSHGFSWVDSLDHDSVGVRGGGNVDLNWSPTFYLAQETDVANAGSRGSFNVPPKYFYSGRLRLSKNQISAGQSIQYKYLIGSNWGRDELQGQSNRAFTVPVGLKDTTLKYSYFNNQIPSQRVNPDTVVVTFNVDLTKAINSGGYTPGDTLYVYAGYFNTATDQGSTAKSLVSLVGALYTVTDTVITARGNTLDYQYYHFQNNNGVRENYYNFYYTGPTQSEAERRQVVIPASGSLTIWDTSASIVQARRQPDFPNARKLNQNLWVKWEVDVRPAYYQLFRGDTLGAIQGTRTIKNPDSIKVWGVIINGPATGGWGIGNTGAWNLALGGDTTRLMWDDGTHGDVTAGDSIYTRYIFYSPDSVSVYSKGQIGQIYKFGVGGSDNEGGTGGYGNNHLDNLSDLNPTFHIRAQWGSINPAFYSAWDYDHETPVLGVKDVPGIARVYRLDQNYPNPFNPSTKIQFQIPIQSNVSLKVFNILGQQVATLVNDNLKPGVHLVTFDAAKYASGVYFYRIEAGSFVSVKKMILMK